MRNWPGGNSEGVTTEWKIFPWLTLLDQPKQWVEDVTTKVKKYFEGFDLGIYSSEWDWPIELDSLDQWVETTTEWASSEVIEDKSLPIWMRYSPKAGHYVSANNPRYGYNADPSLWN